MPKVKKVSLVILTLAYICAGINHFRLPAFYIAIIPKCIPYPQLMNVLAGLCEIIFGVGLVFKRTCKIAAWCIVLMLAAFLPVHIGMISHAPYRLGNAKVTPMLAWGRLVLQPVLMMWAWWHTKVNKQWLNL